MIRTGIFPKIISFLLIICMIFTIVAFDSSNTVTAASPKITLEVEGKVVNCDVPPVIENSRTLVPVRAVMEALGADVEWSSANPKYVKISYNDTIVELNIGSKTAYVNGQAATLDVPAKLMKNRTMIPVRFVSESLGYYVGWSQIHYKVSISSAYIEDEPHPTSILSASVVPSSDKTVVTLKGSRESFGYTTGTLTNPHRFYIDIKHSVYLFDASKLSWNKSNSIISAIRGSQLEPGVTRVVFELKKADTPTVTMSSDNKSFILTFSAAPPKGTAENPYIVALDAGHGSTTGGKRSPDGSLLEYEFNRAVVNRIKTHLSKYEGIKVVLTYNGNEDTSLANRCKTANNAGADIFVSCHANAFGSGWNSARGWEIYVYKKGGQAEVLAKAIRATSIPYLGIPDRGVKTGDFAVIRDTKMPAVLIEHAFMTNSTDCALLKSASFRDKCGIADAKGIVNYLGLTWKG